MKIKIPDRFPLIDNWVTVKLEKGLLKNGGCYGQCNVEKQLMEIDADLTYDETVSTFMHELVEYIFTFQGTIVKRYHEQQQFLITHRDVETIGRLLRQALEGAE